MAWNDFLKWNNQGIPASRPAQNMQQYFSGTDWRSQMQPMNAGWGNTNEAPVDYSNYEDLIMNPEHMPNRLQNLERFADNRFEGGDDNVPGMGKKAIDFIDQPVQFGMRANHPMKGFLDKNFNYKALNQGTNEATQNWLNKNQGEGITATNAAQKKGFRFPSIIGSILGNMKDQFQYRPATEELWDPQTGQMISAEEQDKQNALGGYYSPAATHARRQNKRVMDMLARKEAGKNFSQTNLDRLQELGYGGDKEIEEKITETITPNIIHHTGDGGGGSQPTFKQSSPGGISQAQSRAARTDQGGNVMSGWKLAQGGRAGYRFGKEVEQERGFIEGPQGGEEFSETLLASDPSWEDEWEQIYQNYVAKQIELGLDFVDKETFMMDYQDNMAQGGRAGYQGGELVEQQTDLIEGPQGGEEFQETVVEGQEQPSREQLEALAMAIFQLPLDDLDEQQLLVVYQEAMQGQPMEEAVQEDEVQFAAQGGLAGLL